MVVFGGGGLGILLFRVVFYSYPGGGGGRVETETFWGRGKSMDGAGDGPARLGFCKIGHSQGFYCKVELTTPFVPY
jgi:hypothetical protein